MLRNLVIAGIYLIAIAKGYAQSAPPSFEVASLRPCDPGKLVDPMEHTGMAQFTAPGGRFNTRGNTPKFLLEWAYAIQPSQHSDGPAWFGTDCYQIAARAGSDATDDQMRSMLRTLFAERFHLKAHLESRVVSAYVLGRGDKVPRFSRALEGETHALRFAPVSGPDQKTTAFRIVATRYTVGQIADAFGRQLGKVIVDKTGLEGEYDFTFELMPEEGGAGPLDPAALLRALRDQMGLTLKSEKTAVDFLVIDSIGKATDAN